MGEYRQMHGFLVNITDQLTFATKDGDISARNNKRNLLTNDKGKPLDRETVLLPRFMVLTIKHDDQSVVHAMSKEDRPNLMYSAAMPINLLNRRINNYNFSNLALDYVAFRRIEPPLRERDMVERTLAVAYKEAESRSDPLEFECSLPTNQEFWSNYIAQKFQQVNYTNCPVISEMATRAASTLGISLRIYDYSGKLFPGQPMQAQFAILLSPYSYSLILYTAEAARQLPLDLWTQVFKEEFVTQSPLWNQAADNALELILDIGTSLLLTNPKMHELLFASPRDACEFVNLLSQTMPDRKKSVLARDSALYAALRLCQECKNASADIFLVRGCALCQRCFEERRWKAQQSISNGMDLIMPIYRRVKPATQVHTRICQFCSSNGPLLSLSCKCTICEACAIEKALKTKKGSECFACGLKMPEKSKDKLKPHLALFEPFMMCARCRLPLSGEEETLICRHKVHARHRSESREEVMCSFCGVLKAIISQARSSNRKIAS